MRGGPPELTWHIAVVDSQGNPAELHLAPARVEPAPVTMPVPNEWVNEAVRRMLALENVIRRAASGLPLDLRYPPSAAQRSQTQGRAAPRRKSAREPPQKKLATRTPAPPPTTRPQTRGIQPSVATSLPQFESPTRSKMANNLPALISPWLSAFVAVDWLSFWFHGLATFRFLRNVRVRPEFLRAASQFWDPEVHVFSSGYLTNWGCSPHRKQAGLICPVECISGA
ncbi:uncharacterized protein LOC131313921 [Rhododendron vialii]|uniref:uncharacterized protein LOC131313921 n=1 Tax=Rhododendron vialii TaxID=182163 RepID=UPI00265E4292|nr:uncharacterized protein LOC131313921 [Rhododendron vialii]